MEAVSETCALEKSVVCFSGEICSSVSLEKYVVCFSGEICRLFLWRNMLFVSLEKSVCLFLCGEIGSPFFLCFLCAASEGEDRITLELHQQSGGSRLLEI